jgi:hypothetical protein
MTAMARHETAPAAPMSDASVNLGGTTAQRPSDSLTLDELLADPMVQQLMQRDRTDEASIRRLWQHIAAVRPAPIPCFMPQESSAAGPDTPANRCTASVTPCLMGHAQGNPNREGPAPARQGADGRHGNVGAARGAAVESEGRCPADRARPQPRQQLSPRSPV